MCGFHRHSGSWCLKGLVYREALSWDTDGACMARAALAKVQVMWRQKRQTLPQRVRVPSPEGGARQGSSPKGRKRSFLAAACAFPRVGPHELFASPGDQKLDEKVNVRASSKARESGPCVSWQVLRWVPCRLVFENHTLKEFGASHFGKHRGSALELPEELKEEETKNSVIKKAIKCV